MKEQTVSEKAKNEKLFDAIENIDNQYIEEAISFDKSTMIARNKKNRKRIVAGFAAAAAIVIIAGVVAATKDHPLKTTGKDVMKNEAEEAAPSHHADDEGDGSVSMDGNDSAVNENGDDQSETGYMGEMPDGSVDIAENNEVEEQGKENSSADLQVLKWSGKSKKLVSDTIAATETIYGNQENERISKEFVAATADFAIDILKQCIQDQKVNHSKIGGNKNILISPLSTEIALAMTANGSAGKTLSQIEKVIGGTQSVEELNENLSNYIGMLTRIAYDTNKEYEEDFISIQFANSIWINKTYENEISDDFLRVNSNYYYADVYSAQFDDSTVNDINYWVNAHTEGKIHKMIDNISEETIICLINTLLFSAKWEKPFTQTADGEFTTYDGVTKGVEVMKSEESCYIEDDMATGFCKPYWSSGSGYNFVALLPNKNVDVMDYVSGLDGEHLMNMLNIASATYNKTVDCTLPKFSVENDYELIGILKSMGIVDAFDEAKADFSNMFGKHNKNGAYIGEVLQKTYISVDENGTEAAGAALVRIDKGISEEKKHYKVNIDRPFIYAITDSETNIPIFIGVVLDIGE